MQIEVQQHRRVSVPHAYRHCRQPLAEQQQQAVSEDID